MRTPLRNYPRSLSRPRRWRPHHAKWGVIVTYESTETISVDDAGSGLDAVSASMTAKVASVADAGHGSDTRTISAILSVSESGSAAEVIYQLLRTILAGDAADGSDAISQIVASVPIADVGSGSETVHRPGTEVSVDLIPIIRRGRAGSMYRRHLGRVAPRSVRVGAFGGRTIRGFVSVPQRLDINIYVSDVSVGADGIANIAVSLSVAESGAGAETFGGAALVPVADVGSGSDALTFGVSFTVADVSAAMDALSVITAGAIVIDEDGYGTDAVGPVTVSTSIAEVGTGSESPGIIVSLSVAETGHGAELLAIVKAMLRHISESGGGTDDISPITVSVPIADTGTATDFISQVLASLSVLDSGAGVEALVRFDPTIDVVRITFSFRSPGTDFSIKKPEATFTFK